MTTINEPSRTGRQETASAMMSTEDMKQRVDEFGDRLRQLHAQEVEVCKDWLGELERGHQQLKNGLEEYINMLTTAGRQMQTNFQDLREYLSDWAELTNAFNRVFNRGHGQAETHEDESQDGNVKTLEEGSEVRKAHEECARVASE
jgi:hypothetical protein